MGFNFTNVKFLFGLIGLLIVNISFATDGIEVVTAEGSVLVGDAAGKSQKTVQLKSILPTGNVLTTGNNARAVVRVESTGFLVMGKNSQVEIGKSKDGVGFFKHISGIIYYAMNSVKKSQRSIEVRTATTTIGIRGTRFIVTDEAERNEIGMRKGTVNVESLEGEFEIHKKALQDEFEAYKQEGALAVAKEKSEFEAYKANTQKEFVEYKREFSLGANRMASFDGKKVVERPLSDATKNDMESFESYADEWLKSVHD